MFGPSWVHQQIFVRSSPDFRAFFDVSRLCNLECMTSPPAPAFIVWFRLSCVHVQIFVRSRSDFVHSCPNFRLFMFRRLCVHVQTFVRSRPDFCSFSKHSCVHVQIFVHSLDFCSFLSRLLFVQQNLVQSCPDYFPFIRFSFIFLVLDWLSSKHIYSWVKSQCFSTKVDIVFVIDDKVDIREVYWKCYIMASW